MTDRDDTDTQQKEKLQEMYRGPKSKIAGAKHLDKRARMRRENNSNNYSMVRDAAFTLRKMARMEVSVS